MNQMFDEILKEFGYLEMTLGELENFVERLTISGSKDIAKLQIIKERVIRSKTGTLTPLVVAIVGSRTFNDYDILEAVLNGYNVVHIVSGGARGCDTLAEQYAKSKDIPTTIMRPDYDKHKKAATFIRNAEIVKSVDLVVAFQVSESRGTQHTIDKAAYFKVKCRVIKS